MSISVNVGNFIPAEVVEVGQEISVNQLAAITAATSPSAVNPFTTLGHTHIIGDVTGLQTAIDGKANATHTHLISAVSGLQDALDSKALVGHTHSISSIAGLQVELDAKALLSHAHIIGDVTGLQTALDGKSATTHLHTGVYALASHAHIIGDTTGLQTALDGKSATTHLHTGVYAPVTHTHVIADTTGLQTALDGKSATTHLHTGIYAPVAHSHAISEVTGLQTALDDKFAKAGGALNTSSVITIADGTSDSEMGAWGFGAELTADNTKNAYLSYNYIGLASGTGFASYSITADTGSTYSGFTANWFEYDMGRRITLNQYGLSWDNGIGLLNFNGYFTLNKKLVCSTSSGVAGINIGVGGTEPASTQNGDMWITTGGSQINYRDGNGVWRNCVSSTITNTFSSPQVIDTTSATLAGLRITQKGTANAIEVEDSTTPDSTRFTVDQYGKVGIGVAPDATAALRIDANGIKFNGNARVSDVQAPVTATGTYNKELQITVDGINYRIPCRQV